MGSHELQASSDLAVSTWHRINWAARYRQVRSRQRRIVQAVPAGVWCKVKRLSYLWVHSFAARAFAVKRVTENPGKKTPGVDGDLWNTPEKKAEAVARIGRWPGYRPAPLKRIYIPKKNGQPRLLSIPTLEDRARQAVYLGPATDRRNHGGSDVLRVSTQASMRGCHRPMLQDLAAENLGHRDLGRGHSRVFR